MKNLLARECAAYLNGMPADPRRMRLMSWAFYAGAASAIAILGEAAAAAGDDGEARARAIHAALQAMDEELMAIALATAGELGDRAH